MITIETVTDFIVQFLKDNSEAKIRESEDKRLEIPENSILYSKNKDGLKTTNNFTDLLKVI